MTFSLRQRQTGDVRRIYCFAIIRQYLQCTANNTIYADCREPHIIYSFRILVLLLKGRCKHVLWMF